MKIDKNIKIIFLIFFILLALIILIFIGDIRKKIIQKPRVEVSEEKEEAKDDEEDKK